MPPLYKKKIIETILNNLNAIYEKVKNELEKVRLKCDLEDLKVKILGRKGLLSNNIKKIAFVSKMDKPIVGKAINNIKKKIEQLFLKSLLKIESSEKKFFISENIDITLPGCLISFGKKHPISIVLEKMILLFENLGFSLNAGPELEYDFFNFEALNIPKDHPARDMQDTFYVGNGVVLRTHTSSVQIRHMLSFNKPPIRIISPGPVYRRDQDITHSPMFHQMEGLFIDKQVTFSDIKNFFSEKTKMRMRSSYFPFTEPSVEVDISCFACKKFINCRLCKDSGWIEIMGAGMVDPNVLDAVSINSEKYSGFAFGVGIERVAMLKYGIKDIRYFYENNLNFLSSV